MITVNQLSKRFSSRTVVDHLSFSVAPGEVLGFLGPNGAGKSTTMKMITGFLAPDSGSITVFNHDLARDPVAVKSLIGYLPEGAPSYSDMTAAQFLRFIADVRGLRGQNRKKRIEHVIERLALDAVLHQTIDTLSKGYKRRVGLAQAIIHDPRVLILDEPTDGLDPNQKHQVRELIRNLSKDKIVIISTHILEEVTAVCSRAIIVHQGKIVADNTPAQLQQQSRYHQAITVRFHEQTPVHTGLFILPGVAQVCARDDALCLDIFPEIGCDILPVVNQCIRENNLSVEYLHVHQGRLDDVFRRLTRGQL